MKRTSTIQEMIDAKRAEIKTTEASLQGQRIELEQLQRMRRRTIEGVSPQTTAHRHAKAGLSGHARLSR
jgi:hypothetical protein